MVVWEGEYAAGSGARVSMECGCPGMRSTQSPHPLRRLNMESMPSWVPTANFWPLHSYVSARSNSKWGKLRLPFYGHYGQELVLLVF